MCCRTTLSVLPGARRCIAALALAVLCGAAGAAQGPDVDALLASEAVDEQLRWGERFEHGEGVTRDVDTAVRLY